MRIGTWTRHSLGATLGAVLFLTGAISGRAPADEPPADRVWSYAGERGPDHWAALSPDFAACASGKLQSPIDIRVAQPVPYTALIPKYRAQVLDAVNDGRGVHLLPGPGDTLAIQGEDFALTAIHFHVPGEHRINGVSAAAEIHLVHLGAKGRHLMVAIPVQPGPHPNATLNRIVERLPLVSGERVTYRQVGFNPLFLLPSDRSYYSYTGSLGNPPCTEPADWILFANPIQMGTEQAGRLARATGVNVRPIQPLNGRPVYAHLRR
jgi:carbonic anhydrase